MGTGYSHFQSDQVSIGHCTNASTLKINNYNDLSPSWWNFKYMLIQNFLIVVKVSRETGYTPQEPCNQAYQSPQSCRLDLKLQRVLLQNQQFWQCVSYPTACSLSLHLCGQPSESEDNSACKTKWIQFEGLSIKTNYKTVFGHNRLNHNYIDVKLQNDKYPLARSSASWTTTLKANFLLLFFIRKDFSVPPARYSTTTQQILLGMLIRPLSVCICNSEDPIVAPIN